MSKYSKRDHHLSHDRYQNNEDAKKSIDGVKHTSTSRFDRVKDLSSSSEYDDKDIEIKDDEENEEEEIERRRRQRQELLKKFQKNENSNEKNLFNCGNSDLSLPAADDNCSNNSVVSYLKSVTGPTTFESILKNNKETLFEKSNDEKAKTSNAKPKQFDMFADEKDEPDTLLQTHLRNNIIQDKSKKHHESHLVDNWDDSEGYYRMFYIILNSF